MEKVYLKFDIRNGNVVACDYGTAWTMLLIGPFYPLLKRDYRVFSITLITEILINLLIILLIQFNVAIFCCLFITFLTNLLFAFNYNMIVIEYLLKRGYIPINHDSCDKLLKKGIYFKLK